MLNVKKQTSEWYNSTKSEIIFWTQDWNGLYYRICFVGSDHCRSWEHESEPQRTGRLFMNKHCFVQRFAKLQKRKKSHGMIDDLDHVAFIPSHVKSSHQEALLYVFENNETMMKMIIKGRSPTMRHASRTNKVALDWLFDRINLDPKNQIKFIFTPKTNSQTYWQRETSHVMNGIIFCVCSTQTISVPWKSHSKVETDDEFGLSMQRKDSWCVSFYCIRKPLENQTWKSISSEFSIWAVSKNHGDLLKTLIHQATRNELLIRLRFLKCKSDELMDVRTRRVVLFKQHTDRFIVENDNMDFDIEKESVMS